MFLQFFKFRNFLTKLAEILWDFDGFFRLHTRCTQVAHTVAHKLHTRCTYPRRRYIKVFTSLLVHGGSTFPKHLLNLLHTNYTQIHKNTIKNQNLIFDFGYFFFQILNTSMCINRLCYVPNLMSNNLFKNVFIHLAILSLSNECMSCFMRSVFHVNC